MTTSAKIIADSLSPDGYRLTTFEVVFHRFILAEVNTHRVFSRNSASSRAIPVSKILEAVSNNCAIPLEFGTNQPGMQAGPPLKGTELDEAQGYWVEASLNAIQSAEKLAELGVHKQVTNRLLEPFMWHTAIISGTNFEGWFAQRNSELAQPEIHELAKCMLRAIEGSQPESVGLGGWHLPYIQDDEWGCPIEDLKRMSVARCARVSYLTHGGIRSHIDDFNLYEKLITADPPHWSPLEHVATPSRDWTCETSGNFGGWDQLRHLL